MMAHRPKASREDLQLDRTYPQRLSGRKVRYRQTTIHLIIFSQVSYLEPMGIRTLK
jgi:hypothetical protein